MQRWVSTFLKGRRSVFTVAIAALASLMVVAGCSSTAKSSSTTTSPSSSSKPPWYIVGPLDLTGAYGQFGEYGLDGLKAEISVVNKQGGVLGHQIVLKYLDDGSNPSTAVLAAKQLLSNTPASQILFFEPGSVGVTTEAVLPITTQAKVLDMTLTAVPQTDNVQTYPYNFGTYPAFTDETLYAYAYTASLYAKNQKVGTILGTDAGDQAELSIMPGAIEHWGDKSTDLVSVDPTTTDYTSVLAQMQSDGVTAIIVKIDDGSAYADIMNGIQQLGWKNVMVIGSVSAANGPVLEGIPAAVKSQFIASGAAVQVKSYKTPQLESFISALEPLGPSALGSLQLSGTYADQVRLAVWAAEKAGTNNTEKMVQTLDTLHSVKLPANYLITLPQPLFSPQNQDLNTTKATDVWSILYPGAPVNGQFSGKVLYPPSS
jgi:ABC-type branched-subunit amino acid transport system substrate-binding protein